MCANSGLVPRPLISRDFILTEMVSLIQIETMKKVRRKGLETLHHQKFKLPPELSFWEVLVYINLSQYQVVSKKFEYICSYCSCNPKIIQF